MNEPHGPVHITCELTRPQAFALAELCKRIGWTDVRSNAASDTEALNMIAATEHVRSALEQGGVAVR